MSYVLFRRSTLWAALICLACSLVVPNASAASLGRFAFSIVSTTYRDLDGDHDPFPDTGETGRVVFTIRNGTGAWTGVKFVLVSSDPDVACIIERHVAVGNLASGQEITIGSIDPSEPGFTFRASDTLASGSGSDPAHIELCLRFQADFFQGLSEPVCVTLPADIDVPAAGTPSPVSGPDGVPGTADDGTVLENFDIDRDGDGQFTVNDTFRMTDAGTGQIEHGFYARGTSGAGGSSAIPGIACGGFRTPAEGNSDCVLDPDFPMDWHLHCPPGSTACPNVETGPCVDGCTYETPQDGQKASTPPNSLHMGAHYDVPDSTADTTHLRTLQAFVSAPLNLTLFPHPGDLELSMSHIANLMDNHGVSLSYAACLDCGDVQIQLDRNADPAADDWGPWDKLAPFQNAYDHATFAWSTFGSPSSYCIFAPADAGTAPPAPRGVHETMCFPQGAWSHCGTVRGTTSASVGDCAGPGSVDPSGKGVWVETKFNLASYLGQRVRIRWIGSTWEFDGYTSLYYETYCYPECPPYPSEDGWWLDDVRLTGAVISQISPAPDQRPAPGTTCPALCTDLDGDGYGSPGSEVCPAGSATDCADEDSLTHPGAVEWCNGLDDDCDGAVPAVEADADHDGWRVCNGECDDGDPNHPKALEWNDGLDNQCPGMLGFGVIDEISGRTRFPDPANPDLFTWFAQTLATSYQVARSSRPDFAADCVTLQPVNTTVTDPVRPPVGGALYYLVRAQAPHVGSWGQNSSGGEITGICGL